MSFIFTSDATAAKRHGKHLANGSYADFMTIVGKLFNPMENIFWAKVQGPSAWQFKAIAISLAHAQVGTVVIDGISDPTPPSFATDWPLAFQLNSPNFNVVFGPEPDPFTPGGGRGGGGGGGVAGSGVDITTVSTDNYADFKILIAEVLTGVSGGGHALNGPVFYRSVQDLSEPSNRSWNFSAFAIQNVQTTFANQINAPDVIISVNLNGPSDQTPPTFATDFVGATQLVSATTNISFG